MASRLLRVEELAEILAFDFDAGPIPKLSECRLKDPVEAVTVLSTCITLLSLVNVGDSQVVQFAHLVKEFLTSTRFPENLRHDVQPLPHFYGTCSYRHHSSMSGYSIALGRNVTRDALKRFPLAKIRRRALFRT